jgi:PmbA protein
MIEVDNALNILSKIADGGEIYFTDTKSKKIEIKKGKIETLKETYSSGYSIRVIKNNRMGFTFSNELKEGIIEKALNVAKIAEEDKYLSFPEKQVYPNVKGLYDKSIRDIDIIELKDFVEQLIDPCKKNKVMPTSGSIAFYTSETRIWNTNGVKGEEKGTVVTCFLSTVAKNKESASGFYYDASRSLDLDFHKIGEEATRLAIDSLHAKRMGTKDVNLILKPQAVSELLENVFIPSFSADNVQRNRSFLQGKLGHRLFSPINIVDDGTLKSGLMSGKFDSEGVRMQKTPLVEKGILKGYLYDTYTANKGNTHSTGNADRNSYSTPVKIDSTNFIISGEGGIGEGLVVHGLIGAHTANSVTGDFSTETRNAFLNGVPIKKAIISGNIFDLLNRVEGVGKDYMQVSSLVSPSIEFSKVRVVG